MRETVGVLAGLALLAGCGGPGEVTRPVPDGQAVARVVVDYQLGGGYPPAPGVGGVVRDSTDVPEPGAYSICYVNGFQTQPADRRTWLEERADLVLHDAAGSPVVDEAWPDELLLDITTEERRTRIADVVRTDLDRCAARGFDAVEIDNLDSFTRSGGLLDEDDAVALARRYAAIVHDAGLAVAQKNTARLGARGRDEVGFDLAVVEECHRWDECAAYTDVYGEAVLDVEYADDLRGTFAEVCADPQTPSSTVLRDRDLVTPADPAYVFEHC